MHCKLMAVMALSALLAGCGGGAREKGRELTGGDPHRGVSQIAQYGCGSCHTIPGIPGAHGRVGPTLEGFAGEMYVAGALPNNPPNVERWIQDPHSINEKTSMPNVGVSATDATDIAAYLYSLK
jgi:cytochrome c